jgi:TRAP-type C4-dicarboxylate transport system permease small subunit
MTVEQSSTLKALGWMYVAAIEFAYACHWALQYCRLITHEARFVNAGGTIPLWVSGVTVLTFMWMVFLGIAAGAAGYVAVDEVRSL